jgi:hypothetical protein
MESFEPVTSSVAGCPNCVVNPEPEWNEEVIIEVTFVFTGLEQLGRRLGAAIDRDAAHEGVFSPLCVEHLRRWKDGQQMYQPVPTSA